MPTIYLMRHTESVANTLHILAGQENFALSHDGKADAEALAKEFSARESVDAIFASPLLRAQQTAAPFVVACDAPLLIDERLKEQHLGKFSGMTYSQAEADPDYCKDRTARWGWEPVGGGESYRVIAERVDAFLEDLLEVCAARAFDSVLIVTHAVTLRLFRACLEKTLPRYPEKIASNGEIWKASLDSFRQAVEIKVVYLDIPLRSHGA